MSGLDAPVCLTALARAQAPAADPGSPPGGPTPVPTPGAAGGGKPSRPLRQRIGAAVRRTVGVGLLAAALWWLVLPLIFPVTSDAVVNARTVQVRAPIDGTVSELAFDVGDPLVAGRPMARLDNRHLDTSGLTALTARRDELVTRRERLDKELDEAVRAEATCRGEADRHREAVVVNLEATLKELTSKARAGQVQHGSAVRRLDRTKLVSGGVMTATELDSAAESESITRIQTDVDEAAVAKCRAELKAAAAGIFLQKDTPHFQQRADELAMKVPQLRAAAKEAADLLARVEEEIGRERDRTERLSRATAVAPVAGTVWVRQGNHGQGVKQNEVLYEIADGGTVFVEAVVHQRFLGAVTPGTPAVVNVTGGPSLVGRVHAVRTGRPGDNEPTFAFGVADPDPKKLRVMIAFDPGVLDPSALIGRHVRVLVADPAAGPCQCAVSWLFSHVRLG